MAVPNLDDLKRHLNEQDSTDHDGELAFFLAAAMRLLDLELDRRGAGSYTPLATSTEELLQFAVYELVRDMWAGTQAGGGGREFGQAAADVEAQFTAGRPALPPYVVTLLSPFVPAVAPRGSFPAAQAWPDPLGCEPSTVTI